jgi:hypothetical protein
LNDNSDQRDSGEPFYPFPVLNKKGENEETNRQKPDYAGRKPVSMLEKDSPDPSGDRKEKHVVTETVWPIRYGHTRIMARDKPAEPDQHYDTESHQQSECIKEPFR